MAPPAGFSGGSGVKSRVLKPRGECGADGACGARAAHMKLAKRVDACVCVCMRMRVYMCVCVCMRANACVCVCWCVGV